MKKKTVAIIVALVIAVILASSVRGYTKSMNYIISYTPSIDGVVTAVYDDHFHLLGGPTENDPAVEYRVSRNIENGDSYENMVVGDRLYVHYDGVITEDTPPQINKVYAVTLDEAGEHQESPPMDPKLAEAISKVPDTYSAELLVRLEKGETTLYEANIADHYYPLWMQPNSQIVRNWDETHTIVRGGTLTYEEIIARDDILSGGLKGYPGNYGITITYGNDGYVQSICYELDERQSGNQETGALRRPLGDIDKPGAVFNDKLKDPADIVKLEIQLGNDFLFTVDDPENLEELGEKYANVIAIPYRPQTLTLDTTLHFIYADGTVTSVLTDLRKNVYWIDGTYYNFAFRDNGQNLTDLTYQTMRDLLEMSTWDKDVGEYERYGDFYWGF